MQTPLVLVRVMVFVQSHVRSTTLAVGAFETTDLMPFSSRPSLEPRLLSRLWSTLSGIVKRVKAENMH